MEPIPESMAVRDPKDWLPTRRSLLSRLRNVEDDLSWRAFFDTYWRLIYNVARKSGLNDSEAQDIVQETVIAVAKKMPEFRYDPARGSFKKWLLLITRRRVHDHLRRVYRSLPEDSLSAEDVRTRTEAVSDPLPGPDERVDAACEEAWRENLFQAALVQLRDRADPKQYQVFDFCVLQNIPAGQVARLLGLSRAQVYLAKHRLTLKVKRSVMTLEAELNRRWSR